MINGMDDTKDYSLEQTKRIELLLSKCNNTINKLNQFKIKCAETSEKVKSEFANKLSNVHYLDDETRNLFKLSWIDRDNLKNQCINMIDGCINLFDVLIRFYQDIKLENNNVINKIKKDFVLTKKPPPENALPIWPSVVSKSNKNLYFDDNILPDYIDEYNILDNKRYAYKEYNEIKKILINTFDNFKEIPGTFETDGYISPIKQYIFKIPKERKWLHNKYGKILYKLSNFHKQDIGNVVILQIYLKTNDDNFIIIDEFEQRNGKYYVYDAILEPIYENGLMNKFRIKLIDNYV
jgi:hypothetical protein